MAFAVAMGLAVTPQAAFATPDPYLTGGSPVTGYSGVATAITDLQLTGTGNPTVPVKLRVTSGSLSMTTTTGLTFTGGSTGSTLQFSGSLTNVNAALATLRYTRSGTGTDTLEASLVQPGEVFFDGSGHLYEYVSYTATWSAANTNAQTRTKYGATGYLTTIASQAENDFVAARLSNAGWMGASDAASEGDWKWVTGPESGTSFWSGNSSGSTVGGRYANWGTGEPNDAGSNEDCAQFLTGGTGKWNDLPCSVTTLPGYVVEYGSPSSPIDISTQNVAITTLAANSTPNAPTTLGPTGYVNGSWSGDSTPTLSFSASDPDSGTQVRYRVQIDDTADFSSPVVDYTSGLAAQGSRSFTIGQAAGTGSYSVGSGSQELSGGSYYWRVKTIDDQAAESSYTTANSGSVGFRIDTTAPTAPSNLVVDSQTTDNTPTITWSGSSDSGVGLSATPYTIQWSQDASFSSYQAATSSGTSYTILAGSSLTDGVWYFRVRAEDTLGNGSVYSATASTTVDTTAPTQPANLVATSARNDATPTWIWTASSDSGVGLQLLFPYLIEWSQSADFSGAVYSSLATDPSYTHTSSLADGTWYARVRAYDALSNQSEYSEIASITIDTYVAPQSTPPTAVTRKIVIAPAIEKTPAQEIAITPPEAAEIIYLNVFQEYLNGSGKPLTLQQGQVIYFTHKAEDHTATVKEIGSDYVIVTIASTPTDVRVALGQTALHDVDGDGKNDVSITFASISNGQANLIFKQLGDEAKAATQPASTTQRQFQLWWVVALVMILIFAAASRRRHKDNSEAR